MRPSGAHVLKTTNKKMWPSGAHVLKTICRAEQTETSHAHIMMKCYVHMHFLAETFKGLHLKMCRCKSIMQENKIWKGRWKKLSPWVGGYYYSLKSSLSFVGIGLFLQFICQVSIFELALNSHISYTDELQIATNCMNFTDWKIRSISLMCKICSLLGSYSHPCKETKLVATI
jgi:hypothetical protein